MRVFERGRTTESVLGSASLTARRARGAPFRRRGTAGDRALHSQFGQAAVAGIVAFGAEPGAATLVLAPQITVVHRHGCELCDEMLAGLETLGRAHALPPVTVVDVDADPDLQRRYGLNVPVLLLDGSLVCRHRLDAGELLRLLRGRGPP